MQASSRRRGSTASAARSRASAGRFSLIEQLESRRMLSDTYLSDLPWTSATSPYSGIKKDLSSSGAPLKIGGVAYSKGLGVHSASDITYNLAGKYTRFTSYVGIDDSVGNGTSDGSSQFLVYVDGVLKRTSTRRDGSQPAELIDVDVTSAQTLRLVTNTGGLPGDNDYKDHANWADAKLTSVPAGPKSVIAVSYWDAASEAGTKGRFRFTRTTPTTNALTVNFSLAGLAKSGTDYTIPASVTFAAGASDAYVDVTPIDDTIHEGSESVILTITPSGMYDVSATAGGATLWLSDNDQPMVKVAATDASAAENSLSDTATFTFTREGEPHQPLEFYVSYSGTASSGTDYTRSHSGSYLTIPAGQMSVTATITSIDDAIYEGDETVIATISNNYTRGTTQSATATIKDNDPVPPPKSISVMASDSQATESGDKGTITVTRTGDLSARVQVYFADLRGSAINGGDYIPLPLIEFLPGQSSVSVQLQPIDDLDFEGDEVAIIELQVPGGYVAAGPMRADITIVDDDPKPAVLPKLRMFADRTEMTEGGADGFLYFDRTANLTLSTFIDFEVSGTATFKTDHSLRSGLTVFNGDSLSGIRFTLPDDMEVEGNETIVIKLKPSPAYIIDGPDLITLTLYDNDTVATNTQPIYLSDLNWTSAVSPFGGPQKNMSAGRAALKIGGVAYAKGVGVHSPSELAYTIGGRYTRFTAAVGIDDSVGNRSSDGSAVFQVWGDGELLKQSSRRTGADPAELLDVDVTGVQILRLVTTTGGDNDYKDHADWADARLHVPTTPSNVVSVTVEDAVGVEGIQPNPIRFRLHRTGDLTQPLTATFAYSGSALYDTDYYGPRIAATFAAGAATVDVELSILNDPLIEAPETVTLTLQPQPTYLLESSASSATATITSDDVMPVVTMAVTDGDAGEPSNSASITFTRTGDTSQPLTVALELSGTAKNNSDYWHTTQFTIPAGSASVTRTISVYDDNLLENDETLIVKLAASAAYTVGTDPVTITIKDDDVNKPLVSITAKDAEAAETKTDEAANPFVFTISRTGDTTQPLTVSYSASGTASNAADYVLPNGQQSIVIPAGQSSIDLTMNVIDDQLWEGNETATFTLTSAWVTTYVVDTTKAAATATIADNDPAPKPVVNITNSYGGWAYEQYAAEQGTITLSRTGDLSKALTVQLTTAGTAKSGEDYDAIASVTFAAGSATATAKVKAIDDAIHEGQETATFSVAASDDYTVGTGTATVTIQDNDQPMVTVMATDAEAAEGLIPDTGTFTFTREGETHNALLFFYSVSGTATGNNDYSASEFGWMTIPAGQSSITAVFTPVNDAVPEPDETIIATVSSQYTRGTTQTASITLKSDDVLPSVSIVAKDADGAEVPAAPYGGPVPNPAVFTFSRTGSTTYGLWVSYAVGTEGVAGKAGASDVGLSQTVQSVLIPVGQTSVDVTLTPANDLYHEGDEELSVALKPHPTSSYIIDPESNSASAVITDDDPVKPGLTVTASPTTVLEAGGKATFTFKRSTLGNAPLTFRYAASGTATKDADYQLIGTAVIPAGQLHTTLDLIPLADTQAEGEETVTLSIVADDSYTLGSQAAATIRLQNRPTGTGQGTGLRAEYYEEQNFSGTPIVRIEPILNFGRQPNWTWTLPLADPNSFSVRFSGFLEPLESGIHTFNLCSAGVTKIWIDGNLAFDSLARGISSGASYSAWSFTADLDASDRAPIVIENARASTVNGFSLEWRTTASLFSDIPTQQLYPEEVRTFTKGINFGGGAAIVDGKTWLSQADAVKDGLVFNTPFNLAQTAVTPNPAVGAAENGMLNTGAWRSGSDLSFSQSLATGKYDVSFYVMENYQSNYRSFDIQLEGQTVGSKVGTMPRGDWKKYTYRVDVADGKLDVVFKAITGDPHVMGMTLFKVT
jgi:hypothetical protein